MALPSSGPISLDDIRGEFGGNNPISLSDYYGVTSGIPTGGAISLSDFYGASVNKWAATIGAGDFGDWWMTNYGAWGESMSNNGKINLYAGNELTLANGCTGRDGNTTNVTAVTTGVSTGGKPWTVLELRIYGVGGEYQHDIGGLSGTSGIDNGLKMYSYKFNETCVNRGKAKSGFEWSDRNNIPLAVSNRTTLNMFHIDWSGNKKYHGSYFANNGGGASHYRGFDDNTSEFPEGTVHYALPYRPRGGVLTAFLIVDRKIELGEFAELSRWVYQDSDCNIHTGNR